jgi:hypothetical protein
MLNKRVSKVMVGGRMVKILSNGLLVHTSSLALKFPKTGSYNCD